MPERNEEIEQAVPMEWRPAITEIVEDIRDRNLRLRNISGYDVEVDLDDIKDIYQNLEHYGGTLVGLPAEAWETSACRWMGRYWHLLIDLFTADEGLSDLVLFVDVFEQEDRIAFKVRSLHVP